VARAAAERNQYRFTTSPRKKGCPRQAGPLGCSTTGRHAIPTHLFLRVLPEDSKLNAAWIFAGAPPCATCTPFPAPPGCPDLVWTAWHAVPGLTRTQAGRAPPYGPFRYLHYNRVCWWYSFLRTRQPWLTRSKTLTAAYSYPTHVLPQRVPAAPHTLHLPHSCTRLHTTLSLRRLFWWQTFRSVSLTEPNSNPYLPGANSIYGHIRFTTWCLDMDLCAGIPPRATRAGGQV